ncbi:hypothetical protein AB1L05_17725 [Cytobacillus horneckiae]|uniref:hypothetical protein n=1 Tax=Cytobacillus horneckiae TaxID=549687 RepID=UPI0039A3B942
MKKNVIFLFIVLMISGCQNSNELKQRFDSAINEVVLLENKNLKTDEKFNRGDFGIAVYSEGKYIELIYDLNNEQVESLYKYNDDEKVYKHYPHTQENLEEAQVDLEKLSYTENIGLK